MVYIDNIRDAFVKHDPANAATYKANAESYKAKVRATLEPLREKLARIPEGQRWLVTCEGAFSYLARDFGLKELYLWPMNADEVGTPQQVRKVIDGVRDNKVPVVFCESQRSTPAPPNRWPGRPARAMAGCFMWTASAGRTGRCPLIWTSCASPLKPSPTA